MILAAEAVGRAAKKIQSIGAMGTFQGFELADDLGFAAFLERRFDGPLEHANIHRLGQAIMSAAGSLQSLELLMNLQSAGDHDNGNERQKLFQLRQEIQAEFSFVKDMVQDDQVRTMFGDGSQCLASALHAHQLELRQSLLVDLILEIVVLDNQNGWSIHTG